MDLSTIGFYATPADRDRLGDPYIVNYTISRQEAKELRNYFQAVGNARSVVYSVLGGILGSGVKGALKGLGIDVSISLAEKIIKTSLKGVDDVFDDIATSDSRRTQIRLIYKYRLRYGQDGGFFLNKVEIV